MSDSCIDCDQPAVSDQRCEDCLEEVTELPAWDVALPRRHQDRRCGHCARIFRSQFATATYCSKSCATSSRGRRPEPVKDHGSCGNCGAALNRGGKKYCSSRCGEIARGQRLAEPIPRRNCALPECGQEFQPKRDMQRCCCEKHGKLLCNREGRADGRYKPEPWNDRRRDSYHRRRARRKGASTGRPVKLADIAERDGWRCHLCRKKVNRRLAWPHPKSPSLDHLIPLSDTEHSLHDPVNVRLAHLVCNTIKGNRGGGEQLLLIG